MRFWAGPLRVLLVAGGIGATLARGASAGIPPWTCEAAETLSLPANGRADTHGSVSAVRRWPLGGAGWSFGLGAATERFAFATEHAARPRRLESVASVLALEYFRGDESVAGVIARPGRYVADRAPGSAWDVPIDALAGFPLGGAWNGVVGVSMGRFYRRALPIGGVVWEPRSDFRVEAVFPEPAVVMRLPRASLRIGGELVGGGFHRNDATAGGRSVEFYAYRVGAGLGITQRGFKFTVTAGVEPLRRFEFASGRPDVRERSAAFVSLAIELPR